MSTINDKQTRGLMEQIRQHPETPLTPHSALVQELYRDGLISIRAVLTPKGERWLGAVKRGGKS